tara:strand:- start:397 stop:711 length:315 start_codon:yes stop_codon:yes gene_type:complete
MIKIFLILIIFSFLTGCQNMKDGLTLQKRSNADEFLVKKKNPLVLPPEFRELPTPEINKKIENDKSSNDIKKLLTKDKVETNSSTVTGDAQKIEQNIINKIKNR